MAKLTKEQISFLKSQDISPSQIVDAGGLSKRERYQMMDSLEVKFYYGGAKCKSGGHTLRTKAGHCIQCHTSKIAYQLRHSGAGFVYIAHSRSTNLVKVGVSNNPQKRMEILRNQSYGNAKDWDLKKFNRFDKDAGRKEFMIHSNLEQFIKPITYEKEKGHFMECREVFSCDIQRAIQVFDQIMTS